MKIRPTGFYLLILLMMPWSLSHGQTQAQAQTQTLKDAVEQAVMSNPEVQSRWHAFRATESERDVAFGAYLPRLDLDAGIGREQRRDPQINADYTRNSTTLTLTQMLYDGFATRNEVRRLDYGRRVRLYELQDASETAALEAARAYFDVLRYRKLVSLAENNYVRHRSIFGQIQAKVQAGVGRRVDLEQAAGRFALAEANLLTETANLHDVSARYHRIVGNAPTKTMEDPISLSKGMPADANAAARLVQQRNPALLAAIENVFSADAATDARNAAFQPRLNLRLRQDNGSDLNGIIGSHTNNVAELVLSYNLFNGGADLARKRQYAEQRNIAMDLRNKTCRDTRQTLVIAYNDTRKLTEQLIYLDQHQLSIEKAYEAYRKQFDIGQRTLLDLLDTENELFQARRAYVNAQHDRYIAYARTHAGIGSLLEALGVSRRESERMSQLEASAEKGNEPEQCQPEAPSVYVADKTALDARAQELVQESIEQMAAASKAATSQTTAVTVPAMAPTVPPERDENQVVVALKSWHTAWHNRNVQGYLDAYAPTFVAADGSNRENWAARRKTVIEQAKDIALEISDIKVTFKGNERATAIFRQDYRSANYHDTVMKTLGLQKLEGRWLIVSENAGPSLEARQQ